MPAKIKRRKDALSRKRLFLVCGTARAKMVRLGFYRNNSRGDGSPRQKLNENFGTVPHRGTSIAKVYTNLCLFQENPTISILSFVLVMQSSLAQIKKRTLQVRYIRFVSSLYMYQYIRCCSLKF